jgi:hypothetical protein
MPQASNREAAMPQHHDHDPREDADIIRWFQALGPPPQGQAPPHLRASVRARIEQQQARRGLWAWLPPPWPAVLVPALAVGLVLSLAVNIWWGIGRQAPATLTQPPPLQAYQFLHTMPGHAALGTLVASRPALREQPVGLGFALQDARIVFTRMGILFADALAALHGGVPQVAAQRLDTLARALGSVRAPPALLQYLGEIQSIQQSQRYASAELAKISGAL